MSNANRPKVINGLDGQHDATETMRHVDNSKHSILQS